MPKIFITLLLIASLAGAAASKASTALPGDAFYPFKIQVNERVAGWMALTQSQKAANATRTANERLSELEAMLVRGNTDSQTDIRLMDAFSAQVQASLDEARILAQKGKIAAASSATTALQIMLSTHLAVLEALHSPFASELHAKLDEVSALRGTLVK